MAKEIDMELELKSVTPNQGDQDTPKRKKGKRVIIIRIEKKVHCTLKVL